MTVSLPSQAFTHLYMYMYVFLRFVDGCTNVVSKAPQLACGDRGSFAVTKAVRSTTTSLLKRPCHEGKFVVIPIHNLFWSEG